jgi:hypothetical protein
VGGGGDGVRAGTGDVDEAVGDAEGLGTGCWGCLGGC